ncbi:hypothetical protein RU639_002886 [Aspergillus parasiticus]
MEQPISCQKILGEIVSLISLQYANVLVNSHPQVAQGVHNHSYFRTNPMTRAYYSLLYIYGVIGTSEERDYVSKMVNKAHRGVRGRNYNALDPKQQLWVASCFFVANLTVQETFFGLLDEQSKEVLYKDATRFGTSLQAPLEMWPENVNKFWEYWNHEINHFEVTPAVLHVTQDVLYPHNLPFWLFAVPLIARVFTIHWLSDACRARIMEQVSTIKDGRIVLTQDNGQSYTAQLLCLIVAGYIAHTVYHAYWGPTGRISGPWLARFTRLWELLKVNKGHFEKANIDLHKKYGPIVRISPNTVSISDPSAIKQIYLGRTTLMKSKFYEPFGDPLDPNLFSETDIKKHAQSRKAVAHLYSMSSLVTYEGSFDRCNVQLCAKLLDFTRHRTAFDVPTWMQFYAHDVIGEITFGKAIGMMEKGQDEYGIAESIDRTMTYASRMAVVPELHRWVSWLSRVARLKVPFQTVQKYVLEQIDSRSGSDSAGVDFLTKLFTLRMDNKVADLDIEKTVSNNIMAGADTTAISLSAVIYSLLKNPGAETKLREEIDTLAAAGKLSNPVTFEQARHMPYLQACLKEALRVHPAVGRPLLRVVPPEGLTIAGQYFPGGAIVGVNAWVAHYNEDIFGRDAATFRPERWLESDKEKLSVMEQSLLTFGAGVRTCIGKNLSMLEMSKVIPELYRQFEFELSESKEAWSTWNDWFVKPKFKCYVRLREGV